MGDWGWYWTTAADKRAILTGIDDGGCYGGPFHAELQLTDRCNLNCGFCSTRRLRRGAELSVEQIARFARELKRLGCHSVTLNGGGEPLFHREIDRSLHAIVDAGLCISNLTTNGTLLSPRTADVLHQAGCQQVIVSLNAGDSTEYSRMMGTAARNFQRILENVAALVAACQKHGTKSPTVVVQFLLHAGNVPSIAGMYSLAVSLGVDRILFNDIAGQGWQVEQGSPEFDQLIAAFRQVAHNDRDRGLAVIHSHNFDASVHLNHKSHEPQGGVKRAVVNVAKRAHRVVEGNLISNLVAPLTKRGRDKLREITDCCIAPWHSMTIRATGEVPVCCALQDRIIGQVRDGSVEAIWNGPAFARIRQQIRRSLREGENWRYVADRDTEIVDFCASICGRDKRCRFRSYYFSRDWPFMQRLRKAIARVRRQSS